MGNAKDVPGRGSQGWDVARAHTAAAARRGPGASPGSCGSIGLSLWCRLVLPPLCLPTSPKNCTLSCRHGCRGWGCLQLLGTGQPGPSWLPHLCQWGCSLPVLPPLSPYFPGALCTAPCPSWLRARCGEHEAATSTGEGTPVSPKLGDRGVLAMEVLTHQSFQEFFDMGNQVGL